MGVPSGGFTLCMCRMRANRETPVVNQRQELGTDQLGNSQ